MKRSYCFTLLSTVAVFAGCKSYKNQGTQPNIILFLVDDMGWQDTSLAFADSISDLNKRYHTPNMERLAAEGMQFTQAYASAICSPTRVSLMTGMNAARHRVTNWTLQKDQMPVSAEEETLQVPVWNVNGIGVNKGLKHSVYTPHPLPKVLKNNGYTTIHVGKAHFGAIGTEAANPLNIGFDVNIAGHAAGGLATYMGIDNFQGVPNSVWNVPGLEEFHGKDIFLTEALTQKALETLDSVRAEGKPFFLYMAHYAVHIPIMGDKRFVKKYYDMGLGSTEAKYASMIEGMDKSLGDIMDYLEKNNLDENTIVIFMSDNGGLSAVGRGGEPNTHNYPLVSGKGSTYEGGIREPMIVKWTQKVKAKTVCNDYVIVEDFYPTILEMARVKMPKDVFQPIDGKSFVPFLEQSEKEGKERALFWHYPNHWGLEGPGINFYSTIRKGDWKLIYYHRTESFELFNIKRDISEKQNLAEKEPEKVRSMAKELGEYLRKVEAQMPIIKQTGKQVPYPDEAVAKK